MKTHKGKTHKGLKKRLKKTGTGKLLHRRTGGQHLMSGKSGKKSRQSRRWRQLSKGDAKRLRKQFGGLV